MKTGEPMGFMAACKEYFGMLPGQTLKDFRDEVAKLNEKDREEISAGLVAQGYSLK